MSLYSHIPHDPSSAHALDSVYSGTSDTVPSATALSRSSCVWGTVGGRGDASND